MNKLSVTTKRKEKVPCFYLVSNVTIIFIGLSLYDADIGI